ncbi:adenylate/guanylate cyclase domain-containing protein [Hoeflea prorocentri]|uniref:Adenylate/guanylate cyclase domain-containing protein n=2 Tax=Hoeflea prorocentri TaxID=1922333 RepID=A0A9X3ZGS0_9HYPH|nr:adenylate/guanylate cyclase domain-containing protein [Hoeflea prorocentri]MCY6380188.1 adenylate/guanylate cyclase domain-containing protein [Hoeflea prorocentri]MDA5397988.1 adenylate/guanylate cyclase domain-containing protein [Hoeflea prorocentri]
MSENSNVFDRSSRLLLEKPYWIAVAVVLALILLPVAVWLDLRHLSNESLMRQANDLNAVISEIRSYYARNVVGRIQQNGGETTIAHNYEEIDGGVPIPATLSIELGAIVGTKGDNIRYRFVSDEVFERRTRQRLDAFEAAALSSFREAHASEGDTVTEISGSLLERQIRIAVPVIMGQSCVTCHNGHPESPRKDWKVGDVRGIQAITVVQPLATNLFSFKYLLAYLLGAGFVGIAFIALQWRQGKQFLIVNNELEEANSFLASVSLKISKYLSPQVYKSIFSGERDAVISTERKKLTIFFSDIKDFTVTTERLQPEELTRLLNEYFTEMTSIAQAHGATVDKFIGDAILAFFGDPETKGAAEDARACLNMAIAMQRRMAELCQEWRKRGIENPFQVRMGINTGYCNVGNFGSEDRMDYTIIGAEANLAARLQSIAEPGGIVLSYETFALVDDMVRARPLEPITLKGISRKVVPYAVVDVPSAETKQQVLEENTGRFHLRVNFDGMELNEERQIEAALKSALDQLRRRRPQSGSA